MTGQYSTDFVCCHEASLWESLASDAFFEDPLAQAVITIGLCLNFFETSAATSDISESTCFAFLQREFKKNHANIVVVALLGEFYCHGIGVDPNWDEAEYYFRRGSLSECPVCQFLSWPLLRFTLP